MVLGVRESILEKEHGHFGRSPRSCWWNFSWNSWESKGMMVINNPLIRPYFLGGWVGIGGGTLRFPWEIWQFADLRIWVFPNSPFNHEKNPGWLGYIGDDILPSYMGISINHEIRIPSLTNEDSMESRSFFSQTHHLQPWFIEIAHPTEIATIEMSFVRSRRWYLGSARQLSLSIYIYLYIDVYVYYSTYIYISHLIHGWYKPSFYEGEPPRNSSTFDFLQLQHSMAQPRKHLWLWWEMIPRL